MKKHSKYLVFLLIILLFAGCKTLPAGSKVKAIDLLDDNSSFFIAIPAKADLELVDYIISNNISELSDSDKELIEKRIDKIYCGLSRQRNNTQIQVSVDANIPSKIVSGKLNKNKNVKSYSYKTPLDNTYKVYKYEDLDIAFPSNNLFCGGRDVASMLDTYDEFSKVYIENDIEQLNPALDEDIYNYLLSAENEICFYANKPQSFLTILTGTQLDLKLNYVKGSFTVDEQHPNQYILDLDFNFKNDKYLKAGKALLSLAFSLTGSANLEIIDNDFIIKGAKLNKQQLYKIFSI